MIPQKVKKNNQANFFFFFFLVAAQSAKPQLLSHQGILKYTLNRAILKYTLKRTEKTNSNRYLHANVHYTTIHNSQRYKKLKCPSTDEWIKKMW